MNNLDREYIYGINPCVEVVRGDRRQIHGAYLSRAAAGNQRLKKLVSMIEKAEVPIQWVEKGKLNTLCQSREHQGAVLQVDAYPYTDFDSMLAASRLLLIDNVEDPQNVGSILRSAEVFGFCNVLLPNKGVPEVYPSVVKASAGAVEFLDITRSQSANQYVKKSQKEGFVVVALDAGGAVSLSSLRGGGFEKLMLVIGGEDRSVGQFILNCADHVVRIEQRGRINSLNASVAAGIAMQHLS